MCCVDATGHSQENLRSHLWDTQPQFSSKPRQSFDVAYFNWPQDLHKNSQSVYCSSENLYIMSAESALDKTWAVLIVQLTS